MGKKKANHNEAEVVQLLIGTGVLLYRITAELPLSADNEVFIAKLLSRDKD